MPTVHNQVLIHYLDNAGKTATTFWTLADQGSAVPGDLSGLAYAVQACSQSAVTAVQLQTTLQIGGTPAGDPYSSVQDRVHMIGRIGQIYPHYDIIAPSQGILLPDNKTLDLENPAVMALVAAMLATLGNSSGDPLELIKRGTRQWAGRRT
ncbi:MAG: hypothetical protein H7Z74_13040 [Anaerolineae bacterium]|nr:hypothetical protein [Gemmatimonadaceae bacterium]